MSIWDARRPDEALAQYQKTLELAPEFVRTHYFLALSYLEIGSHREAIAEIEQAIRLSDENPVFVGALGFALAKSGDEQAALHMLDKLEERSRQGYVPAFSRALVHIGMRRSDQAFEELDRAFDERSSWLVSLNVEPLFDPIRDDPRFCDLVGRVGLSSSRK